MHAITEAEEWTVIARRLMEVLQYTNGMVIAHLGILPKYPEHHVEAIAKAAQTFFEAHPEFMNDEDMEQIVDGEYTENQERYGIYPEYAALDKALNDFHDGND